MKHLILYIWLFISFSLPNLMAQGTVIGIVNAEQIIRESETGQAFYKELEQFNQTKKNELESLYQHFQNLQKDLRDKAASMSEDKQQEISLQLRKLQTEIKRKQDDAERESQLRLNEKIQHFESELVPLIRQVAMEKGLDLVINTTSSNGILFVSEKIDITQDVIDKYNAMTR